MSRASAAAEKELLLSQHRSREERIQAITAAALDLKERIMEQSRKLADTVAASQSLAGGQSPSEGQGLTKSQSLTRGQSSARGQGSIGGQSPHGGGVGERHVYQSNEVGAAEEDDLPGVKSLRQHAAQAEKVRKEGEAASRIQATYRGYHVRKSLDWKLPTGGTLGGALRGARRRGDGGEGYESDDNDVRDEEAEDQGDATPTCTTPTATDVPSAGTGWNWLHHHHHHKVGEAMPPSTRTEPWKRTGGDAHSVINIYTRQHQESLPKARATPPQRGAETVQSSPPNLAPPSQSLNSTPRSLSHQPPSTLAPAEQSAQASSLRSQDHSYSLNFEPTSASGTSVNTYTVSRQGGGALNGSKAEGGEEGSGSELSAQYSRDSLFSAATESHVSSPPSGVKTASSRSSSSPRHSDHTLTPPRSAAPSSGGSPASHRSSASTPHRGGGGGVNRERETVSVITPPGSTSFVDSFTSATPPTTTPPPPPRHRHRRDDPPPAESAAATEEGRLSPRSLELKLHAELNLLETVEDSMRKVSHLESTRAISRARQETEALAAELLKSSQREVLSQQASATRDTATLEAERVRWKVWLCTVKVLKKCGLDTFGT